MATRIPLFYRLVFTYFDFFNCILASYFYFFERDFMTTYMHPTSRRNPDHDILFYNTGGTMLLIAVLHGGLLRYASDVNVWKIVNLGVLLLDISMLAGFAEGLAGRGVTSFGGFSHEDWTNVGITSFVTVVRAAFIADVGLPKEKQA